MGTCLVAQSGGPTAVINASLAGVVRSNQLYPLYDRVLGGLQGIEGVLEGRLHDLTNLSGHQIEILKQTPSSVLGTCRYKLKDANDFARLTQVMKDNDVDTLFYIGGNDSMETVRAMAEWAIAHNQPHRFIGIPKTVDNDLVPVDHCPGFPSAAKLACSVTHATRMDYDAYTRPEVFVMETMGRDAGWIAASTCLTGDVDLLVVPEVPFDEVRFLDQVQRVMDQTRGCYIVASEGARYADGTYLSAGKAADDGFAHAVLGGAAQAIKQMILDAGIAPRGIVQDLSRAARSSNFCQSLVDVNEAYDLGMCAHMRSADPSFTSQAVGVRRGYADDGSYNAEYFAGPAEDFALHVRHLPEEWILPNYLGVTEEALTYFRPLIQGEPRLVIDNGIPATFPMLNR